MKSYLLNKVPSQIQNELAKSFRILRKNKKLAQLELAKKSGVSLGSIKRFEQTGQISLASLLKLAHLLERLEDFDTLFKINEDFKEIEKLFKK
jgi:transcriptional regulator with XRE-family HTH domain